MARSIKNLIAALLVAISGFLVWTEVLPMYDFTSQLKTIIQEKSDLIASRTEIIEKISSLNKESEGKYSELQRLALIIPEGKNIPELISSSDAIFSESGMTLSNIKIGEISDTGLESVNKISVELSGQGSYLSLISLLTNLEKHIRLNDVVSFSAQKDINFSSTEIPVLNVQISATTYWLKEPSSSNPSGEKVENDL